MKEQQSIKFAKITLGAYHQLPIDEAQPRFYKTHYKGYPFWVDRDKSFGILKMLLPILKSNEYVEIEFNNN